MKMAITSVLFVAVAIASVWAAGDESTIYDHLRAREGFCLVGYIPTAGSGVTIATGLDLGQKTKQELSKLKVPAAILNKFNPYFGKKTKKAVEAAGLKASNLKLTTQEAEQVDLILLRDNIKDLKQYFDKLTVKGQAVLVSLRHWAYRLGNNNVESKLTRKVNGKFVNYVWDVIKTKKGTDSQLADALKKTLATYASGTAGYNRINAEYSYLTNPSLKERIGCSH